MVTLNKELNISTKKINRTIARVRRSLKRTFSKKRNQRKAAYMAVAVAVVGIFIWSGTQHRQAVVHANELSQQLQAQEIKNLEKQTKIKAISEKLEIVQEQKANTAAQLKQKADNEKKLKAEIERLKVLRAQRKQQSAPAAPAEPQVVGGCGDNKFAQFIYQKESGCNLNAVNPGGCRGIGQACPGDKLPCGADYACQNAFFTNYANTRYGGWEGAYNAWLAQGWW